jgi:hypothetical protein
LKTTPISFSLVGILASVMMLFIEQERPQVPTKNPDRVLAAQPIPAAFGQGTMNLYQRELPNPTTAARLRYTMHTKPAAGADSNRVFYVVVSGGGPGLDSLIWLTYENVQEFVSPKAVFSANLLATGQDMGYLVMAKSIGTETLFRLYDLDLKKHAGSLPLHLDPERKEEWPKPAEPRSEVSYSEPSGTGCTVASIEVLSEHDNLLVRAHREPSGCALLQTTFDPHSQRWSKVMVLSDRKR